MINASLQHQEQTNNKASTNISRLYPAASGNVSISERKSASRRNCRVPGRKVEVCVSEWIPLGTGAKNLSTGISSNRE